MGCMPQCEAIWNWTRSQDIWWFLLAADAIASAFFIGIATDLVFGANAWRKAFMQ
jgi:hypothetical protein